MTARLQRRQVGLLACRLVPICPRCPEFVGARPATGLARLLLEFCNSPAQQLRVVGLGLLLGAGYPERIYVDRTVAQPFAYLWPVAADDTYTLVLTYQTYVVDLTKNSGVVVTGLDRAWERWGDYQTSADIGDGPVARMPADELTRWERKAEQSRGRLSAYHNRQGARPRLTKFKG